MSKLTRPAWLLSAFLILVSVLAVFAIYEVRSSHSIILHTLDQNAISLSQAVAKGGENAIKADEAIVKVLAERLLNNAHLLRELDRHEPLVDSTVTRLAETNDLFRVNVFDSEGIRVASNVQGYGEHSGAVRAQSRIAAVIRGEVQEMIVGLRQARFHAGDRFAVAVARHGGGAIVVNIDAAELLAFRRTAGPGKLVQDVGENTSVVYVVIQDSAGVVLASRGVEEVGRIAGDPFLELVQAGEGPASRRTHAIGSEVFETVMPFHIQENDHALLRVALSAEPLRQADERTNQRLATLLGLLILLAAIGGGFVSIRKRLDRTQDTYRQVMDQLGEAVISVDARGAVVLQNPAAQAIMPVALSGSDVDPDYEQNHDIEDVVLRSAEEGRQLRNVPVQLPRLGGDQRELEVSASPLISSDGRRDGAVAVIRDLTERKALERDLSRRDRMAAMGELAAGVAHEIRNPLNAIGMTAQRLGKEYSPKHDDSGYREKIRTMVSEVQRMGKIVREFLEFARPPELSVEEVSLGGFTGDAASVMESRVVSEGLDYSVQLDGSTTVLIDPGQMTQVIVNLIENAVQACDHGGITVACGRDAEEVWISVTDTGSGIPEDRLERIFDPYYTTHSAGSGLGLSLSDRIVSAHGGRIEVVSDVGVGTVFTIRLPGGGL
jgi:two-component system, NtrC family, sensor histidine kinase HydH